MKCTFTPPPLCPSRRPGAATRGRGDIEGFIASLVNRLSELLLAISGERPLCGCRSSKQLSLPVWENSQSHREKEKWAGQPWISSKGAGERVREWWAALGTSMDEGLPFCQDFNWGLFTERLQNWLWGSGHFSPPSDSFCNSGLHLGFPSKCPS